MFDAALSQMDWRPTQAAILLAFLTWIGIRAILAWAEHTKQARTDRLIDSLSRRRDE